MSAVSLQQIQNQIGGSSLFLIRSKVDWNIEQYFKTFDCDYVYIVQCHAMSRKYMYWFTPTWMYEYKLSSWNTFVQISMIVYEKSRAI